MWIHIGKHVLEDFSQTSASVNPGDKSESAGSRDVKCSQVGEGGQQIWRSTEGRCTRRALCGLMYMGSVKIGRCGVVGHNEALLVKMRALGLYMRPSVKREGV